MMRIIMVIIKPRFIVIECDFNVSKKQNKNKVVESCWFQLMSCNLKVKSLEDSKWESHLQNPA